jgi:hypothetical protein
MGSGVGEGSISRAILDRLRVSVSLKCLPVGGLSARIPGADSINRVRLVPAAISSFSRKVGICKGSN